MALPGTVLRVTTSLVVLETSGFIVSVDSVETELPRGRVVEMRPGPDATLALPAEVLILVSRGPPLVTVPDVLGLEEAEALAVLDSLGLVVSEVREVFRFGRDQGIVVEQEPPSDTLVERGTAVRLAVGRRGG
jgi:serine/threonine-protein kinase